MAMKTHREEQMYCNHPRTTRFLSSYGKEIINKKDGGKVSIKNGEMLVLYDENEKPKYLIVFLDSENNNVDFLVYNNGLFILVRSNVETIKNSFCKNPDKGEFRVGEGNVKINFVDYKKLSPPKSVIKKIYCFFQSLPETGQKNFERLQIAKKESYWKNVLCLFTGIEFKENQWEKNIVPKLESLKKEYDEGTATKNILSDEEYDYVVSIDSYKRKNSLKNSSGTTPEKRKTLLPAPMPSLINLRTEEDLVKWINKIKEYYENARFCLSTKLDGISVMVEFLDGKVENAWTKGNGIEGEKITKLVKYIIGENFILPSKENIFLRGEIVLNKKTFEEKYKDDGKYKTARGLVAGVKNQKNFDKELTDDLDIVFYEVVTSKFDKETIPSKKDQLKIIKELGLMVVDYKVRINILPDPEKSFYDQEINKIYVELKSKCKYDADGIVVEVNNSNLKRKIGQEASSIMLKGARAYKPVFLQSGYQTTVKNVQWKVTRTNFIKPTVFVAPVNIDGITIKKAYGFNAKFIKDNNIGPGAKIEIARAGDAIPTIVNVLKGTTPELPDGSINYYWNDTNVDIISDENCKDTDSDVTRIAFFFKVLGIGAIDEGNVKKLYDSGYDTIDKVVNISKEQFLEIRGFKDLTVNKILSNIDNGLKNVPLYRLAYASGKMGNNIGEKKLFNVWKEFGNDMFAKQNKEKLIEKIAVLPMWSRESASIFVSNMKDFRKFFEKIKDKVELQSPIANNFDTNDPLYNKKIVVSTFRDQEFANKILKRGGVIANTVSKESFCLVVKDDADKLNESQKIKAAKKLNIRIISRKKFEENFLQ